MKPTARAPYFLLVLFSTLAAVSGLTINVDLNNGGSNHYSGTGIAPGDTGTAWNSLDVSSSPVSKTITTVVDSDGVTVAGAAVTIASSDGTSTINRYSTDNQSTPNPQLLMRDYTFSGTYDVTVTGLESGTYEFWFFGHGDWADQTGTVTIAPGNGGGSGSTANSPLGRDLINGGDGISFVHFENLAVDGSGAFEFQVDDFLNGFQLRKTSESPPAPEPTKAFNADVGDNAYTGIGVAPDPGTTWNQFPDTTANTRTVTDIAASDGSTLSGVDITITSSNTVDGIKEYGADSPGNPNPLNLMRDYYYGGDFTVDIAGLNAGNYELYVFAHGDQANQNSTVTVAAGNGGGSDTTAGSGSDNRDLMASGAEGYSYLRFPVSVGTGGTLSFVSTGYLTGFQVVPVPEVAFTILPVGAILTDGTAYSMTAAADASESVDYQWQFSTDGSSFSDLPGETGDTLDLTASSATTGYYQVVASTSSGSIVSPSVYFGLGSTQSVTHAPAGGSVGIAIDQPLRLVFPSPPTLGPSGVIRIHDASNGAVVASIDRSTFQTYTVDSVIIENALTQTIQGESFYYMPIAIWGNEAWITLSGNQRLDYDKTYYVTMDSGLFFDSGNQAVPAITDPSEWLFTTRRERPVAPTTSDGPTILSVDMDGGGDFATIQGALDWIPQNNTLPRTILVEPGTYHELVHVGQNRRFVTIMGTGTNRGDVVIHHPSPATTGSSSAGILRVSADDLTVRNLTIDSGVYVAQTNPAGPDRLDIPAFPGRINSIRSTADRFVCENLLIKGGQDTLYAHSGTSHFAGCEVWGSVDFIYGGALAVFDDCDIVQVRSSGGPICAPSTNHAQPHGLVFINSRFPRARTVDGYPYDVNSGSTRFMRPWGKDGATEIINCELDSHFTTKGWSEWGGREATCRAREFGNTMAGGGAAPTPSSRQSAGAFWLNTSDPDYNPATDSETDPDVAHPGGSGNRQQVTVDPADYTPAAIFGEPYFGLGGWLPPTGTTLFTNGYGSTATGGEGGAEVTVSNAADLLSYASSAAPFVINVSGTIDVTGGGGTYGKVVDVLSNKTIQGVDDTSTIIGNLFLGSGGVENVIIRNLNLTHPGSIIGGDGKYVDGGDGISVWGANNVLVSHCTIYDCADGGCDITHGADYVTVEWCKFYYTAASTTHQFPMILGNTTASNYHATLHHNWFAEGCNSRMPSGSFSRAHVYNNYFSSSGNFYCTNVRVNGEFLVENNYYDGVNNPCYKQDGGRMTATGNIFDSCTGYPGGWDSTAGALTGNDPVFIPPYAYVPDLAADVPAIVMAGAGNGSPPIPALVTLGDLHQVADGSPKPASYTTDPSGLAVTVTYGGGAVPAGPGNYSVVAEVTEPGYTGSSSGTLVIEAANSWFAWQITHFAQQEIDGGKADPDANADADFIDNLGEYALGFDPHSFDPPFEPLLDGDGFSIIFSRPAGLPDVIVSAQSSDDLSNWSTIPMQVLSGGDPETVKATDALTSGDPGQRFIRLRFESP